MSGTCNTSKTQNKTKQNTSNLARPYYNTPCEYIVKEGATACHLDSNIGIYRQKEDIAEPGYIDKNNDKIKGYTVPR